MNAIDNTACLAKPASIEVKARHYTGSTKFFHGKELVGFRPDDVEGREWIEKKINLRGAFWENGTCWFPTHSPEGKLDGRMLITPWSDGIRAFVGELPYPSDLVDGKPIPDHERARSYPTEPAT